MALATLPTSSEPHCPHWEDPFRPYLSFWQNLLSGFCLVWGPQGEALTRASQPLYPWVLMEGVAAASGILFSPWHLKTSRWRGNWVTFVKRLHAALCWRSRCSVRGGGNVFIYHCRPSTPPPSLFVLPKAVGVRQRSTVFLPR